MKKILTQIIIATVILYASDPVVSNSPIISNGQFASSRIFIYSDEKITIDKNNRNITDSDSSANLKNTFPVLIRGIIPTGKRNSIVITNSTDITDISFVNSQPLNIENIFLKLKFGRAFKSFINESSINVDYGGFNLSHETRIFPESVIFTNKSSFTNFGNSNLGAKEFINSGHIIDQGRGSKLNILIFDLKKAFRNSGGILESNSGNIEAQFVRQNSTDIGTFLNFSETHKIVNGKLTSVEMKDSKIIINNVGRIEIKHMNLINGGTIEEKDDAGNNVKKSGTGIIDIRNGTLFVDNDLKSEGAGFQMPLGMESNSSLLKKSFIHIRNSSLLRVKGDFVNGAGSELYIQGVVIAKKFISTKGSKIILDGMNGDNGYGKISAEIIEANEAEFVFKTNNLKEGEHVVLDSNSSDKLKIPESIIGIANLLGNDEKPSLFFNGEIFKDGTGKLILKIKDKRKIIIKPEKEDTTSRKNPVSKVINMSGLIADIANLNPKVKSYGADKLMSISNEFIDQVNNFVDISNVSKELSLNILNKTIDFRLHNFRSETNQKYAFYEFQKLASIYSSPIQLKDKFKNLVYINLIGGYGKFKSSNIYSYGINSGVDTSVGEKIFAGLYVSYLNSKVMSSSHNDSNNIQTGIYARFGKKFEFDFKLSYNLSLNNVVDDIKILHEKYSNRFKYQVHMIALSLTPGYRFNFQKSSVKPYIGLDSCFDKYLFSNNNSLIKYKFKDNVSIALKVGLEYSAKINNFYLFLTPSFEIPLLKTNDKANAAFKNSLLEIYFNKKEYFGEISFGVLAPLAKRFHTSFHTSFKISNNKTMFLNLQGTFKYLF